MTSTNTYRPVTDRMLSDWEYDALKAELRVLLRAYPVYVPNVRNELEAHYGELATHYGRTLRTIQRYAAAVRETMR